MAVSRSDHWRPDRTCSYCGSISPAALFEAIDAGEELGPTDKSYKVYVGRGRKFYFQHFSDENKALFIALFNEGKVKIREPGYFYVLPFFVKPVSTKGPGNV